MLIKKFFAPAQEVSDIGLQEINMPRLGRFVALAGRNGSGKSRILNKVEHYVLQRFNMVDSVSAIQKNIEDYAVSIKSEPGSIHLRAWIDAKKSLETQLQLISERVFSFSESNKFKSVRFVPKNLQLQDPRNHQIGELTSRFQQAKAPGLNGAENNCLFYIQQLQVRWWNADHQRFPGTAQEKETAIADYEGLKTIIFNLLGVSLDRNIDGDPILYGRRIADCGLSDGQRIILQLCVALHAQRSEFDNTVFLLDEPENHLHPSAAIDLLKSLYGTTGNSQIWVATHSVPLLAYIASVDPMSLWCVENGSVSNAGRHPQKVLNSLLGDEEQIGHLNAFTGLPAQLAAINYASESLLPPKTILSDGRDPQVSQIQKVITDLAGSSSLNLLDFGAGKGRLLEGLAIELLAENPSQQLSEVLNYYAFDPFLDDRDVCSKVIGTYYSTDRNRYFNYSEDFFSNNEDGCLDIVVMCNVLHEISPRKWIDLLSSQSLINRGLKEDGYLLVVEDQRIPVGESAHEYGFIVLDTSHLRTLFAIKDIDVTDSLFSWSDAREDGRLKAHLISKSLLSRISSDTIKNAITQLKETAKAKIRILRASKPTYANGQLHGFWTQQFANAELYLSEVQ